MSMTFPADLNFGLHKKQWKREDQKNLMHRREEGKPVPKPQKKTEDNVAGCCWTQILRGKASPQISSLSSFCLHID